jgi:hypothetical protein
VITWYRIRRWWALRKARNEALYWFGWAHLAMSQGQHEIAANWRNRGLDILRNELERWP